MRPQFGSPPWTAVLTRLDDATARAAVRASPSEAAPDTRSEEHTSELQSQSNLVCRLLLEKKNAEYLNIPDNEGKAIALVQGRAAAALFAPPTDRPLLKAGFKRLIYMDDEFQHVTFSVLQAMHKQIQEKHHMCEHMVNVLMKPLFWIRANHEAIIYIIMKTFRLDHRYIFFFLLNLPPPSSTLFPNPPLFQ